LFAQSVLAAQWSLSAHFGQAGLPLIPAPPQSLSVSLPFFTRSEQLGVWQMFDTQTPL
jgi:hypothetical protein